MTIRKSAIPSILLGLLLVLFSTSIRVESRILSKCEAAQELAKAGVERSFISTYVCIMSSESGFDTRKKTGPGHKASYSYGVFQISSDEWCNAFRPGGKCQTNCNNFINDDIKDDIACAKIIAAQKGFQHWKGWQRHCKNGKLPDVSNCLTIRKRSVTEGDFETEFDRDDPLRLAT